MNTRKHAHFARALLVTALGASTFAVAAPAQAGSVTLWVCHGPVGQPLGAGPLVADAALDGVAGAYGAGCSGQASGVGDGGVSATFARADPAGGSSAAWLVGVPANVALVAVGLTRATTGFGGPPQTGDPVSYEAATSTGTLESASLADASDLALSGSPTFAPVTGATVTVGVRCALPAGQRCAAPPAGTPGVEVAALALGVVDGDAPKGAVGGLQSPVAGSESLSLVASDVGVGLESATATLDGRTAATIALGGPSCAPLSASTTAIDLPLGAACPATVSGAQLTVDTTGVPDGAHQLAVVVSDASGNTTTVVDETITVLNHPAAQTATVNLGVGGGSASDSSTAGGGSTSTGGGSTSTGGGSTGGGSGGPGQPVCTSPQLSVRMASRPLRISRHRVAVVRKGRAMSFVGRLTCLRGTRRVNAPSGTVVQIFRKIGSRATLQTGVALIPSGFRVLLAFASSRTVIFSYGSGASLRRVRIPVLVSRVSAQAVARR